MYIYNNFNFVFSSALSRRLESQQSSSMVLCLFLSLVPSSVVAAIVINGSLSFPQPCPVVWSRRNRHQCFFVFSSALSRRLESQKSSSMFLCLFLSLVPPSGAAEIVINVSLSFPQPCPAVWSRSNRHQCFFVFSSACPVVWSRSNHHQWFFVFSSALSRHLESQQSSSMVLCLFLSLVPSSGVAAIVINVSLSFPQPCPIVWSRSNRHQCFISSPNIFWSLSTASTHLVFSLLFPGGWFPIHSLNRGRNINFFPY